MNNILTVMKKELFRFFSDKRMLLSTIFLPGVMIYVMYSFMGEAFSQKAEVEDNYKASVYAVNMPSSLKSVFDSLDALEYRDTEGVSLEDMKAEVSEQSCDLIMVYPEKFEKDIMAYDSMTSTVPAPQVEVYYNSSRTESVTAYQMVVSVLDQFESSMTNKFDVNISEDIKYDLASDKDITAQVFASLFPMLLMMFIFSACMAIAPESIAGEKERGTLTTVLVTPIKRSQLAIGKIIALSIIALLSGISSFVGTALSLPKLMGGASDEINTTVYGVQDYILLLLIVLCSVLVIIALISIISAYARNVKEAGTYVTPLMIVVMIVSITTMFGSGAPTEIYWYLIPIYNSVQCMNSVFLFSVDVLNVVVTIVSNIVYAGIFVWVLTKMFQSEKILFAK